MQRHKCLPKKTTHGCKQSDGMKFWSFNEAQFPAIVAHPCCSLEKSRNRENGTFHQSKLQRTQLSLRATRSPFKVTIIATHTKVFRDCIICISYQFIMRNRCLLEILPLTLLSNRPHTSLGHDGHQRVGSHVN